MTRTSIGALTVGVFLISATASLVGCAPVMEARRPTPVDMKKFVIGEPRIDVLAELGNPIATVPNAANSCDIYKLYTRGLHGGGKAAAAAGEAVADVLTLGLTEVIFTPVEAGTRNSKHTVLFCYGPDNKVAEIKESRTAVDSAVVVNSTPVSVNPVGAINSGAPATAQRAKTSVVSNKMWTREVVVNRDLRAWFGPGGEGGLLVTTVEKDGPAGRAGIRAGDVITEVDGQPTAPYLWSNAAVLITNGEGGTATLTVARK